MFRVCNNYKVVINQTVIKQMKKIVLFIITLILFQIGFSQNNNSVITDLFNSNSNISVHQDKRIERLVKKHIKANGENEGMLGYRIQIYSGSGSEARKEAMAIRTHFIISFPDVKTELIYQEPNFKLRVGNFRTKSEGYKLYKSLLQEFPGSYFVIEQNMEFPEIK